MAELYLLKFPADEENDNSLVNPTVDSLPFPVKEKISKTADKKTRIERIYAYSFLFNRLAEHGIFSEKAAEDFFFTEEGKPYIKNSTVNFSVSHSDGIAAVAISFDRNVGVDIEKIDLSKSQKLEKISNRFCRDLKILYDENLVISRFFRIEKNEFFNCKKPEISKVTKENLNFVKWTALEASLKCHGGGFSVLCEKESVISSVATSSGIISVDEEDYAVSVSKK